MVSLKVLIVLALVVAVVCEPTHLRRKQHRLKRQRHHNRRCRSGTDVALRGGLRGVVGFLFKGLKHHYKRHTKAYNDLINIRQPTNMETSITFLLKITFGSGSLLNKIHSELGDLLIRMIFVLIRQIICLRGLLGNLSGFCSSSIYSDYVGISADGINSVSGLYRRFKCNNAVSQVEAIINKLSRGRGLNRLSKLNRAVLQIILEIARLTERRDDIRKSDLTFIFSKIFSLVGIVGNVYSKDLGTGFTDHAISACDKYLVQAGCPSISKKVIVATIDDNTNSDDTEDSSTSEEEDDGGDLWGNLASDTDDYGDDGDNSGGDVKNEGDNNNDNDSNQNSGDEGSGNDDSRPIPTSLGKDLQIIIKPLLKKKGLNILPEVSDHLIYMNPPKEFDDVAKIYAYLSVFLGAVLEKLIPGLGNYFGRTTLYISRRSLCLNENKYPRYCSKNFADAYGISGVSEASDSQSLARIYKVVNAKSQIQSIIDNFIQEKNIVVKGAQKKVIAYCQELGDIADNVNDDSYNKFILLITKLLGVIGNSCDKNHKLGSNIAKDLSTTCDSYIQQRGYQTIGKNEGEIQQSITTNDTIFTETIVETRVITRRTEVRQSSVQSTKTE